MKQINKKKKLIFILSFLLVMSAHAQISSFIIKPVAPIKYEKQNGSLQILSYIKSNELKPNLKARLDGKEIAITKTTSPDSILVWLPLIGDKNVIEICDHKGKTINKQMVSAIIPKDWGYFQNGTIHIIQSSHQDIAWMNTPEYCREERIEDIIIPALDIMKKDDKFTFEMEQTLNLMEFLDKYPNRKEEIIQRYKEGRFFWGATYNQPYEGLATGEQLIRQVYYGRKWIRENLPGCDDVTANNIDVPGRSLQIPQIFAKSGIKYFFISRMGEGLYDWYSPDGSKIFTYSPGNYGWASLFWKFFDDGAVNAFHKLHHRATLWSEYYKTHAIPPHYAVLISCDATKPVNFRNVIDEWNTIVDQAGFPLPQLKNSTSEEYFHTVNTADAHFEKISGERPDLWLYIHGPAHYEATAFKRKAGILLPAAETFYTMNALLDGTLNNYPRAKFDRAWIASIYPDHGLGGNNGDITDKIFEDSLAVGYNIGNQLLTKSLSAIADKVKTARNDIVVFNDLTWKRSDIAYYELDEQTGNNVMVKDDTGKEVPSQIITENNKKVIAFQTQDIPSIGYKTYTIAKGKKAGQTPENITQLSNFYENRYYKVTLGDGGIVSLYDKELYKELLETSKFKGGDILEAGYTGNGAGEFTTIRGLTPGDLTALSAQTTQWTRIHTGALFVEYQNTQQTINAKIEQSIRIYHSQKKIDFNISLIDFNGAHNRQYRIAFPLNMKDRTINYEVPMAVLEVGKDEMKKIPKGWGWDGTYVQRPEEAHPREIQNFISASGNGFGLTISSEVAVADYIDPSREEADYPILQGILLSSHKSCHGAGNWYAQPGTHHFHFSISSHNEGWEKGYQFGIAANHPLKVVKKANNDGSLQKENNFISISDPFVALSLVKKSDNDDHLIIRLTEMLGRDTNVSITLPKEVKKVIRTNLIEDEQEQMNIPSGTTITLPIKKNAIETFKLIVE
jgi:alpha-mannosidase